MTPSFHHRRAPPGWLDTCAATTALLAAALAGCSTVQDGAPRGPDIAARAPVSPSVPTIEGKIAQYTQKEEALYLLRFNQLVEDARVGAGLESYDPMEQVTGAKNAEPLPSAVQPALSPAALAAASDYAAQRNSSALVIWKDGVIQAESYFGTFDKMTPIVSKSLAKPVTALLIGRALQQGYIASLDQPVADFITEWKGDPSREKILIRHLLDMRSGLLPQGFSPNPADILNRAYLHPRHDEVIINDYPMTHVPGDRYEYSNANSELIAPVIERATGMRYGAYLSEALLRPIGAMGGQIWVNRDGGMAHSGCCLLLPAESWVRMAMLIMADGQWQGEQLLPEGYANAMRTPTVQNPYYGMGVWVAGRYIEKRGFAHPSIAYGKVDHSEPYLDKDIVLFDGNSNQVVYMIPSQNMIILRTGQRPPEDKPWDNTVLPNLLIRDAAKMAGKPMPEPQPR